MSRWLPASVALLLVLLVAQDANSTSRPPARCSATGSQTLYDDQEVRVFTREITETEGRTVACSHINGRRTKLAQDSFDLYNEYVDHISAPGRWLGYSVLRGYKEHSGGRACILRLKTGKRRCKPALPVLGLGATRVGSLAWLTYDGVDFDGEPIGRAVYKWDVGAEDAVKLDSGDDIDPDSFAVGGQRIYWTKAGEPKSATM
ncbi:MAG: hypothetical protein QOI65_168, partial [Thermoleophilaceae bacterium]|nr:hypothetical protein [Thermoleophilaceae bacterium]